MNTHAMKSQSEGKKKRKRIETLADWTDFNKENCKREIDSL
jgi:hypothetical protein